MANLLFEVFVPPSGWTEDSNRHYLLLDLPDFKREELKLEVDDYGRVIVTGERQVSENKYIRFEQAFKVPENSDTENISGKFEGEILCVNVPKQVIEEKEVPESVNVPKQVIEEKEEPESENGTANGIEKEEEHEKPNKDENSNKDKDIHDIGNGWHCEKEEESERNAYGECFREASREKWGHQTDLLESVMWKFSKNKWIVVTAVLAFSLGMLMSHNFQSKEQ